MSRSHNGTARYYLSSREGGRYTADKPALSLRLLTDGVKQFQQDVFLCYDDKKQLKKQKMTEKKI